MMKNIKNNLTIRFNPIRFRTMTPCRATTYGPNENKNGDDDRQYPNVWEKRYEAAIHRAKIRHLNKIYKSNVDLSPSLIKKLLRDKWGGKASARLTKRTTLGLEITFDNYSSQREYAARLAEICEYINKNELGFYLRTQIESFPSKSDTELSVWIPLDFDTA